MNIIPKTLQGVSPKNLRKINCLEIMTKKFHIFLFKNTFLNVSKV